MTRWIAHRGNAAKRPGGTPTRQTLEAAVAFSADLVEVDVHTTADGVLVLRHDANLGRHRSIDSLTYAELLRADGSVMRLDEADTVLGGRVRLLLDIKGERTVEPLARWLGRHPQPQRFAVCSSRLRDFDTFQVVAPAVARWPTFPDVDTDAKSALRRILGALGSRRRDGEINQMFRDVLRAARDLMRDRSAAAENLVGLPWRDGLPRELAFVVGLTGASGISVHQWLVTPPLVDAAHELGITVTAWTVNREDALGAVVRAGVDYVTTDDVPAMRLALPGARLRYPPVPGLRPRSPLDGPLPPPDREVA